MDIVGEIVLQSLFALLLGGAALGLVIGVWLYLQPERVLALNHRLNKWFSTEALTRVMDTTYQIERQAYRYHRVFGAALLAGAGYILYSLWFRYDKPATLSIFKEYNPQLVAWLLDSTVVLFYLLGLLVLIIALCLMMKPSLLRGVEAWGNQWFTTRPLEKTMGTMYMWPDKAAERHPRVTALLLVLGSLYVLVSLGFLIFAQGWGVLLRFTG